MSVPWFLMAKGKGGGGYKTASGPVVSVNDALAAPLRSLVANIDPVQDLHGYDNPWPAGGGKNRFTVSDTTAPGVTITVQPDGAVLLNGTATSSYNALFYTKLAAGTYTLSARYSGTLPDNNYARIQVYKADAVDARISNDESSDSAKNFTVAEDSMVECRIRVDNGFTYNNVKLYPQIESGSTMTAFAPYSNICPISGWSAVNVWVKPIYDPTANPTATLQLGQTVYGGTLDVTNGVLTVTHQFRTYTSVNGFATSGNNHYWAINISQPISINTTDATRDNYSSNMFKCWVGVTPGNFYVTNFGQTIVLVPWSDQQTITTREQADAWLADNPVEVCIPLATPITIPLTAQEISTLQGENNVWADSGDVTVEYLASGGTDPDLMKLAVAFMGKKCWL